MLKILYLLSLDHGTLSKFVSTPNMPRNNSGQYSSDDEDGNDDDQHDGPVAMETDIKPGYDISFSCILFDRLIHL